MSQSIDFTALEPDIVAAATTHEKANKHLRDYGWFSYQNYFIKFGDISSILSEVETQKHVAQLAALDPRAPHIAKVYHVFVCEKTLTAYAIMEHITLVPTSFDNLVIKVAEAVSWMHRVPAPEGLVFGPLGSAPASHPLFPDGVAYSGIKSLEALERYFNAAVTVYARRRFKVLQNISFVNEPLVLTQSDMHPSNFGVDTDGRSVLLDFGEIGWLPESFVFHTLLSSYFAQQVAAQIYDSQKYNDLAALPNLVSMRTVGHITKRASPPNLGLDDDCYPRRRDGDLLPVATIVN